MVRAGSHGGPHVIEVADILRRHGQAYLRDHAGHLGRIERRVVGAITACRTATLGGHVEACDDCKTARIAWHLSAALIVPPNITLVPLPAKCPELNPQENVWQFMRDNWLSNRISKSYDDILAHSSWAWNRLINQPWRIMSIGLRKCDYAF